MKAFFPDPSVPVHEAHFSFNLPILFLFTFLHRVPPKSYSSFSLQDMSAQELSVTYLEAEIDYG